MYSIFKMSFADGSDGSALTCLIHLVMSGEIRISHQYCAWSMIGKRAGSRDITSIKVNAIMGYASVKTMV